MKEPRPGTKKASVFATYIAKGETAALKQAEELELSKGTAPSWFSEWRRTLAAEKGRGTIPARAVKERATIAKAQPDGAKATKEATGFRPRATINSPPYPYDAHFRFASRVAAQNAIEGVSRHAGVDKRCYVVLEENGKFAIAPAFIEEINGGKAPSFTKGAIVFDLTIRDSRAKVTASGPYQTELVYLTGPRAKMEAIIPNKYLTQLDEVIETPPAKKRARIKK
jgi:hypothetical protein